MKLILIPLLSLTIAACSNIEVSGPRPLDLADAATTTIALAQGATELNPILAPAGNLAGVAAIPLKMAARTYIDNIPVTEAEREGLHTVVDATGALAACNNIGVAVGVSNPIIAGLVCGAGYLAYKNHK